MSHEVILTNATKEVIEVQQLESVDVLTPNGVGVRITQCPHRNGNPEHLFYEAWFSWEGGTLRSSTVIHDKATRVIVMDLLKELTGIDHTQTLNTLLNKYDWHQATEE